MKAGELVELQVASDEQHIFIKVSDTGQGIPEDQMDKLFDRFYQVENEVSSLSGFGIGLSIVKDVVYLHQGEIDFHSVQNEGSTFTIKLLKGNYHFQGVNHAIKSVKEDTWVYDHSVVVPASEQIEHSILIVEDNDQIRSYLRSVFDTAYQVYEAGNGDEGILVAKKELPDIIISDVLMPVKDGIQLTKELKADDITHHIPIILLTARTGLIFKKEGFDIGAEDYISKPFNEQLLVSRVRNLISSRKKLWEKYRQQSFTMAETLDQQDPDLVFIESIRQIIQENLLDHEINPELLSKELGMSHSVIYKKLKQLTGLSIVEFVRDFKLNIAAELLTKYKYSVSETCFKSGFTDRRYFSRAFKDKFGKTPSEFITKE